jgi:hypothetical protein
MALAQTTLPAITPTTVTAAAPNTTPVAAPIPTPRAHPAQVTYIDGQLQIVADGSSLNQILREIGRATSMKITGGVADQRVYGKYGPGAPAEILASLLDGTDCNMLLLETAAAAPAELILTPRSGTVTPPNPNAPGFDDDAREDASPAPNPQPVQNPPQPRPPYVPPATPSNPVPADTPTVTAPPASTGANPDSTPATTPANPASPASQNGPLTPEQIYQQLQQLQKTQPH